MRCYKRCLETGKIKDVSRKTRYRRKKQNNKKTIVFSDEEIRSVRLKNAPENSIKNMCEFNFHDVSPPINTTMHEGSSNINNILKTDVSMGHSTEKSSLILLELLKSTVENGQEKIIEDNEFDENLHENSTLLKELLEFDSTSTSNICRPKNLNDLIESPDFLTSIVTNVDKCPGEVLLMILKFSLSCHLPLAKITSLFNLVNSLFSNPILPNTKYFIDKIFNSSVDAQFHGICPNCNIYIGKLQDKESFVTCENCETRIDLSNPSCENVFMIIDPSENIRTLLKEHEDYYQHIMNDRKYDGFLRKIYDGKLYRKFVESLPENEKKQYLTAILNSDGAPRFESSSYSIWPVYLSLNEIPTDLNGKNIVVLGLWFGKNKPNMAAFLDPITTFLNQLSHDGICLQLKRKEITVRLYILLVCVDSVARAPMQGFCQFNSNYGCQICYHPGEHFAGSMRYPVLKEKVKKRHTSDTIEHLKKIADGAKQPVFGIKNISPLLNLRKLHIINGFPADYMHCCLSGVGKQVTELILADLSSNQLQAINNMLDQIKIPHQLSRTSRSLKDRSKWKAKEWENFILHYSLPIFYVVLSDDLFSYWKLYVDSLFILLSDKISFETLDLADKMLHLFVYQTKQIFNSKAAMTYNVHQLLHLASSVANWGPLFEHSTFSFEAANHDLLQAIHCAKGVNLQIARFISIQRVFLTIEQIVYPVASPLVIDFCSKSSITRAKNSLKISNVTYLGKRTIPSDDLINCLNLPLNDTLLYYRMIKSGCLYSIENDRSLRSDNSYAILCNDRLIKIVGFVVNSNINIGLTIYNELNIIDKISESLFLIEETNLLGWVKSSDIRSICVHIKIFDERCISLLPNLHHY
ncbi:hypothetical protein TKK_0008780 [Trichogramma kaykai]